MPSAALIATLAAIGLVGSFVSGLLGVGGAAFIIPMLLYIPPLAGAAVLDMKEVAGLSIVLVFVAALGGAQGHRKYSGSYPQIIRVLGPAIVVGSLLGGLLSAHAPDVFLKALFATLALIAGLMMLIPRPPGGDEAAPEVRVCFPVIPGAVIALGVGLVSGLVGAGGAFLLVPIMIYVLRIPTRAAVVSSLSIVLLSALAGMVGKVATGQIPWLMALFLVGGALPGARIGVWCSCRMRAVALRYGLAVFTTLMAIRLWLDLIEGQIGGSL